MTRLKLIVQTKGERMDMATIPLDDEKTYRAGVSQGADEWGVSVRVGWDARRVAALQAQFGLRI